MMGRLSHHSRQMIVFLALISLLSTKADGQQKAGVAKSTPANDQGLTVLVLNNAGDVHHETGSFYGLSHLLNEMGIPFETPNWYTGFGQLDPAVHPLVIINDYIDQGDTSPWQEDALSTYVAHGGTIIAPQVIDAELQPLFGVTGYSADKQKFFIEFVASDDTSMRYIDRSEEITIQLGSPDLFTETYDYVGVYALSSETETLANALDGTKTPAGPTIVKRTFGAGTTYALGFSFFGLILRSESNRDPEAQRAYINAFEPGADVIRLFVRAIYEEATGGHFVLKHTIPSPHDSALIVTHDVDAEDAYYADTSPGGWGRAGARQFVDLETGLGITATYLFTTQYITDSYSPAFWYTPTAKYVCDRGFDCQSHSVRHLRMGTLSLPIGSCDETFATYDPLGNPTLCGELRVSQELVEAVAGRPVVSFRSPFLDFHRQLPETLDRCGYACDSSFSAPDVLTNYPYLLMESTLFVTETAVIELPVTLADDGMTPDDQDAFLDKWKDVIDANTDNNAINVLLIHPSRGPECEAHPDCDDVEFKLNAEQEIVDYARGKDLLIADLTSFCGFWRARDRVLVEANHDSRANTYTVTVTNNDSEVISGLTLTLGDPVRIASHDSPYTITAVGDRVVIERMTPGQAVRFTAVYGEVFLPVILRN